MGDELTKEQELKAKVLAIDQESAEAQKALAREMKGATKEMAAQTAELLKKAEAERKHDKESIDKLRGSQTQDLRVQKEKPKGLTDEEKRSAEGLMNKNMESWQTQQDEVWRRTKSQIKETKTAYLDLSESLNNGMSQMGEGIGEFMGALMSGQGGVQSFGTMVAGIFADMAINVGKMAISTGLAVTGIKAALHPPLNPAAAIAAGIALVALGTAVKGGLSSIASGGTSSAISGGQNYDFDTRQANLQAQPVKVAVEVSGELNATPKGLTTTLSKENTRVSIVT
jgi:hypothetical protein